MGIEIQNNNILRPTSFKNYIGQKYILNTLNVSISAALKRKESLGHILFYGSPGLGKTTISNLIANEMKSNLKVISAPSIEKIGDIVSILVSLEKDDILFIDEIHRLPNFVEEVLYSAMEDFYVDILLKNGDDSNAVRVELEPFTLIGATTKYGNLTKPLRDRFQFNFKLELYSIDELSKIIINAFEKYNLKCDQNIAEIIAKSSRGTPRTALNNFKKIRDYIEFNNKKEVENIEEILKYYQIHNLGFDKEDIEYLKLLKKNENGISLKSISSFISEDMKTIEEVIEPYLIQEGYILINSRGRKPTDKLLNLTI
jgi:Holliday junction DNA helicase RuvB